MKQRLLTLLAAFVIGILGFLFTWSAWHLYQDHLTVDVVRQILMQQAQQAQQAPQPTAQQPPPPQ